MEKFDRFYQLHQLLEDRRYPVAISTLADAFGKSEKTVRRYITQFAEYYRAPIVNIPRRGYMYDPEAVESWHFPGLWLTSDETQSLTLLLDILQRFGNGLLSKELGSAKSLIFKALEARGVSPELFENRVRIISVGNRQTKPRHLNIVTEGVISRKQIEAQYVDYQGMRSNRILSPQRLVHYRNNWYMDAWCHQKDGLRTFSIARIETIELLTMEAISVDDDELDQELSSSYGIFSGIILQVALLRFLPKVAMEVASQDWHSSQEGEWDGKDYLLKIPYSDARELIGDVFRYMPDVVVEEPVELRDLVAGNLEKSLALHK